MKTTPWILSCCLVALAFVIGCTCNGPKDTSGVTPGDGTEEPTAEAEPLAAADTDEVSTEVQMLIDAGDTTAIAADMETRADTLRALTGSVGGRARELEGVSEGMTGRSQAIDPRDPAAVVSLTESAATLTAQNELLSVDIDKMRQLVIDLQAEAGALYGPH